MPTMNLVPLTRLSPFARTLHDVRHELERLFGDELSSPATTSFWAPRVNVRETRDQVEISADLPGIQREDVEIQVENHVLTLRGTRQAEDEARNGTWFRIEKVYGQFERTFNLPSGLDKDRIQARLADGVLTVTVPKVEEAKPRQIDIQID